MNIYICENLPDVIVPINPESPFTAKPVVISCKVPSTTSVNVEATEIACSQVVAP